MEYTYEITFDTIRDHINRFYTIHITANNSRKARELAVLAWYEKDNAPHMFHIKVRRVKLGEVINYAHWFVMTEQRHY